MTSRVNKSIKLSFPTYPIDVSVQALEMPGLNLEHHPMLAGPDVAVGPLLGPGQQQLAQPHSLHLLVSAKYLYIKTRCVQSTQI